MQPTPGRFGHGRERGFLQQCGENVGPPKIREPRERPVCGALMINERPCAAILDHEGRELDDSRRKDLQSRGYPSHRCRDLVGERLRLCTSHRQAPPSSRHTHRTRHLHDCVHRGQASPRDPRDRPDARRSGEQRGLVMPTRGYAPVRGTHHAKVQGAAPAGCYVARPPTSLVASTMAQSFRSRVPPWAPGTEGRNSRAWRGG